MRRRAPVRLKHLATLNTAVQSSEPRPYVGLDNIESWTGHLLTPVEIRDPSDGAGIASIEPGDVLFGKLRPYLAKVWVADRPAYASTELLCLRPNPNVESRWLGYVVLSRPFVDWAVATSEGTKMPRTSWEKVGDYRVIVDEAYSQRAIADFLDAETARIDALIAKKRQIVELMGDRLNTAVDQVVWEQVRRLVPLRHVTDPQRQIMYGIVLPGPDMDEGVPIVKGGNVKAHRLRLSALSRTTREIESRYERSRLRGGDIVFSIRGSIGDVELVPPELAGANITQDVARIAPVPDVDARWLLHALRSPTTQVAVASRITGATIRGINIWDLERVRVPVPPRSEQSRLVAILDALTDRHRWLVERLTRQIDLLAERRQALITAAVTGELDVPESIAEAAS